MDDSPIPDSIFWIDLVGTEDASLIVLGWFVRRFDGSPEDRPFVEFDGQRFAPVVTFTRPDVITYLVAHDLHGVTRLDEAQSFVFVVLGASPASALFRYSSASAPLGHFDHLSFNETETIRRFQRHLLSCGSAGEVAAAQRFLHRLLEACPDEAGIEANIPATPLPAIMDSSHADLVAISTALARIAAAAGTDVGLLPDAGSSAQLAWAVAFVLGFMTHVGAPERPLAPELIAERATGFVASMRRRGVDAAVLRDVELIAANLLSYPAVRYSPEA